MEIGAGTGTMSHYWLPRATELHLVEPALNLFAGLQKEFSGSERVRLYAMSLGQMIATNPALAENSFDCVVMVNVLEHIERDLEELMRIEKLLVPGGHLLLFVPAIPWLYGSLDREFGHWRRYEKSQLSVLVERAGLEVVRVTYFDSLGVLPWWVVNRVLRSKELNSTISSLYDRIGVPFSRILDLILGQWIGKNLALIGRKKPGVSGAPR